MDYLLVESYSVAWLTGYASVRQLFLRIKPPDQERPATDTVLLSFHEKAPPSPNFKDGSPFQVFLPRSEFDDLYRILQTESPVYIQLERLRNNDTGVRIGTFKESVGEGEADLSE